jgi:hypothetical protein
MFCIYENCLQIIGDSLVINGYLHTDLLDQSSDYLNSLGIYPLGNPPAYDENTQKLDVDYTLKQWIIIPLTPDEIKERVDYEYTRWFRKNYAKYVSYLASMETYKDNVFVYNQFHSYVLNLATYCLSINNHDIPLDEIIEFPEIVFTDLSNRLDF